MPFLDTQTGRLTYSAKPWVNHGMAVFSYDKRGPERPAELLTTSHSLRVIVAVLLAAACTAGAAASLTAKRV